MFGQQLLNMYERRKIPLAFYSRRSGATSYEVWKDLCFNYFGKIFTYHPSKMEQQLQRIRHEQKIVIETFAFFTLFELGLHEFLTKVFKEVFIPQGLLDSLIQHKGALTLGSIQGKNSLISIDGKMYRIEVPATEVNKEIELVDKMISFIIPFITGNKQTFVDKRFNDMLEKSSIQAVNLSLELNVHLLCDDALLSDLMSNGIQQYKHTNTLLFISLLLVNRLINENKFFELVIKLVSLNYYFVPITADILLYNIELQEFAKYNQTKRAIDTLRDINQTQESKYKIVSAFILKIYLFKNLNNFIRDNWVDYILDSITINDSNKKDTLEQIYQKTVSLLDTYIEKSNIPEKAILRKRREIFTKWLHDIILIRRN